MHYSIVLLVLHYDSLLLKDEEYSYMMVVERSSVTRKSVRPKSGPLDRFWLPEMVPPDRQKMVAPQLPIVVLAGPNLGCHERSCFPRYGGPERPILSTIHNLNVRSTNYPQSTLCNVRSTIHNPRCTMRDRQSTIHIVQSAIDNPRSTMCERQCMHSQGSESEPVMTVE